MKLVYFLIAVLLPCLGFSQVEFVWVDSIQDDFSFTQNWKYLEGVEMNQWGQLSCEGLCPMEIEALKDDQGRIYDDSLTKFYSIIDTTHRYFTHEGVVRAYEYGECNYAFVEKKGAMLIVQTEMNAGTYNSLALEFENHTEPKLTPKAYLIYNSVGSSMGPISYEAIKGRVEISRNAYQNGMLQMRFDLEFQFYSNDSKGPQSWKGKILVALPE